jgi:hypothetical protein
MIVEIDHAELHANEPDSGAGVYLVLDHSKGRTVFEWSAAATAAIGRATLVAIDRASGGALLDLLDDGIDLAERPGGHD